MSFSSSQQTSALDRAHSFHPTLSVKIEVPLIYPCALHLYCVLPPLIFIDPYELANYHDSYTFHHAGISNLELPFAAINNTRSSLLLTIHVPRHGGAVSVEVPLHVRYGTTSANRSLKFQTTELHRPSLFLACPNSLPIDQSSAPKPPELEELFDLSSFTIVPISSHGQSVPGIIRTPVGTREDLASVEFGTAVVFALSFCYLSSVILRTIRRMSIP
ncbi:PIG-X [Mycena epipterygia]|nr:PIG-X [Mycena epipterygia]